MLRFLHCADAHLDTPFTVDDLEEADVRRAELRAAFSSMMLYIRQNRIPLLLIAGDLFSHAFLSKETTALIRREFAATPDCHIVIAPGNHDFYADDSVWNTAAFSENVFVFRDAAPTCHTVTLSDGEDAPVSLEIWGFANTAPAMSGYEVLNGIHFPDKQRDTHRLFIGHAALAGSRPDRTDDGDVPLLRKEQLATASFDYCALGHYHTSDGIRRIDATSSAGKTRSTYYAYAGCPVGRGFSEAGQRGTIAGTLGFGDSGDTVFSVRRLRIARRRYECLELDLDAVPAENKSETALLQVIADTLADAVSKKKMSPPDRDTALRLTVTGRLDADILLSEERIAKVLGPLASFSLVDRTVPGDTKPLAADPTLRGAYYHALADKLQSEDAVVRETAALALRLGLQQFKHE